MSAHLLLKSINATRSIYNELNIDLFIVETIYLFTHLLAALNVNGQASTTRVYLGLLNQRIACIGSILPNFSELYSSAVHTTISPVHTTISPVHTTISHSRFHQNAYFVVASIRRLIFYDRLLEDAPHGLPFRLRLPENVEFRDHSGARRRLDNLLLICLVNKSRTAGKLF